MSITIGTPTIGNYTSAVSSVFTFPHTVVSGTTMLVFQHTMHYSNGSTSTDWVEWNGQRMRLAASSYSGGQHSAIWYLYNPEPGSYDIRAHWSGGGTPDSDYMSAINLTSEFGVGVGDTQTSSAESPSVSYTPQGSSGLVIDACTATNVGPSEATVGAGQTALYDNRNQTYMRSGASYKTHAGSITMSYTTGTGGTINYAGAEFLEKSNFVPMIMIK